MNLDYIGGLFDGTGTITFTESKIDDHYKYYVYISMGCMNLEDITKVKEFLGFGTIREYTTDRYKWYCSSKATYELAKKLLPYTTNKKQQLELAVNHYELMRIYGKRIRKAYHRYPQILPKLRLQQFKTHNDLRTLQSDLINYG